MFRPASLEGEFVLALTSVRSLAEDGIMDRMRAIQMGIPERVIDRHGKVDRRPFKVNPESVKLH